MQFESELTNMTAGSCNDTFFDGSARYDIDRDNSTESIVRKEKIDLDKS